MSTDPDTSGADTSGNNTEETVSKQDKPEAKEKEIGGPKGPEPTRYGDWEVNGIISDF